MWKRVCNCLRRHRRKFFIVGSVVGGAVILNRYLTRKFIDWQTQQTYEYLEQLKRQHHFEGTLQTCDATIMSLAPKVRDSLVNILDVDPLLDTLKSKPSNKLEIWEELKVMIFTQVLGEIYCECLFVVFLRIQLSILGGYMYVDSQMPKVKFSSDQTNSLATPHVQQKYLNHVHYFFEFGIKSITEVIEKGVRNALSGINHNHRVMLKDFTDIFNTVKNAVSYGLPSIPGVIQYVIPPDINGDKEHDIPSSEKYSSFILQKLKSETKDILESADFDKVMSACLEHGLSVLMDRLSECFVHLNQDDSDFTNPHSVALPFARLIPVIRTVIHQHQPHEQGSLIQELLQLEMLKSFAANVYEAFCQLPKDCKPHEVPF